MNAITTAPLDVSVHLANGHTDRFRQTDADAARQLVSRLHPDRLFAQRLLLIGDGDTLSSYLCSGIEAVDLIVSDPPSWPLHRHMVSLWELTREEFHRRSLARDHSPAVPDRGPLFLEVEMTSGRRVWLELLLDLRSLEAPIPLDMSVIMQQFFTGPSLHARRHGGVILLNPAGIVRILARPAPLETPPSAWAARYVPTAYAGDGADARSAVTA